MNWRIIGVRRGNNMMYLLTLATGLMFSARGNLAAVEPVSSSDTNSPTPKYVVRILEMPFGPISQDVKDEIRLAAQGHEVEAVAFALKNTHGDWVMKGQDAIKLDRACMKIMVSMQEETFRQFKEAFRSTDKPALRLRRALVRWARTAETHEALCFTVDSLIQDQETAEDIQPEMEGTRKRLCDTAYNLAVDRIQDARNLFGKTPISTTDRAAKRDEKLKLFEPWWNENKAFLEWSGTSKRFLVNQEAKKAARSTLSCQPDNETSKLTK